jgi:hypothetical protein
MNNKINKKGQDALKTIGLAFMIFVVVFIVLFFFRGKAEAVNKGLDKELLKAKLASCKAEAEQLKYTGMNIDWCGNTVYPFDCGICLGAKDNELKDIDQDGMIDICEKHGAITGALPKGDHECMYYIDHDRCCTGPQPCTTQQPSLVCTNKRPEKT